MISFTILSSYVKWQSSLQSLSSFIKSVWLQFGTDIKLLEKEFEFIKNSEFLSQNRIELFYKTKKGDLLLFSRTIGAYILKKDGKFIKSSNSVLNDWLIKNGVYVSDDLQSFSDGSIPIHSRGGILIIDEDLNILNNLDIQAFENLINDLKKINFSGRISFSGFCEPLLTKNLYIYLNVLYYFFPV